MIDFYLNDLKSKFSKINPEKYYLSYSGGKDSHFLYWFIKEYAKIDGIEIVGCNTLLEFPEILARIKKYSDIVLVPKIKPLEIKERFGIPCFSKEQDQFIYYYQKAISDGSPICRTAYEKVHGTYKTRSISKKAREYVLSGNAHKITHKCCEYLKKKPFREYEKETGKKAILGIRSTESYLRKTQYKSCFTSSGKFTPTYDLSDELLNAINESFKIEVPEIYKYVSRTGCMGCPYGSFKHETEKELNIVSDSQRKYLIELFGESYKILGII